MNNKHEPKPKTRVFLVPTYIFNIQIQIRILYSYIPILKKHQFGSLPNYVYTKVSIDALMLLQAKFILYIYIYIYYVCRDIADASYI